MMLIPFLRQMKNYKNAFSQPLIRFTNRLGRNSHLFTPFDPLLVSVGTMNRTWFGWPGRGSRSVTDHISSRVVSISEQKASDKMYLHTVMCREGVPVDLCIDLDYNCDGLHLTENKMLELLRKVGACHTMELSSDYVCQHYSLQRTSIAAELTVVLARIMSEVILDAVADLGPVIGRTRVLSMVVLQSSCDQKVSLHFHARLVRSAADVAFADYKDMHRFSTIFVLSSLSRKLHAVKDDAAFLTFRQKVLSMIDVDFLRRHGSIRLAFSHTRHLEAQNERQLLPLNFYKLKGSTTFCKTTLAKEIFELSLVQRDPGDVGELIRLEADKMSYFLPSGHPENLSRNRGHDSRHSQGVEEMSGKTFSKKKRACHRRHQVPECNSKGKKVASDLLQYRRLFNCETHPRRTCDVEVYRTYALFLQRLVLIDRVLSLENCNSEMARRYHSWMRVSFLLSQLCEWEISFAMQELGFFKRHNGNVKSSNVFEVQEEIEHRFAKFFSTFSRQAPEKYEKSQVDQHWQRIRKKYRVVKKVREPTETELISSPQVFFSTLSFKKKKVKGDLPTVASSNLRVLYQLLRVK